MFDILFLNEEELFKLGSNDPHFYFNIIKDVFLLHAQKKYIQPLKLYLRWDSNKNRLNLMPAALTSDKYHILGVKMVTSVPSNPTLRQIPRGQSLLWLYSLENGLPLALLAGSKLSAMRTAMITTVAAHFLANPEAERLGLIGAGPISAHHILCLTAFFPKLKNISVYDIDRPKAARFCEKVQLQPGSVIQSVAHYQEAVISHDIVIAATNDTKPFISGEFVTPGTFFSNVGIVEADASVVQKAHHVVVDDIEQCTQKPCSLTKGIINGVNPNAIIELGDIIAGNKSVSFNQDAITFFNAIGMGMFDIACGHEFLEKARLAQLGLKLSMDGDFYNEFGLTHEFHTNYA